MLKISTYVITAVTLGSTFFLANVATVRAATCHYNAQDSAGKSAHAYGVGHARKMSKACERARRECNRKLKRAFKKGKAGRGAKCYRLEEVSG